MDERLYKATIEGSTETLLRLIKQDPLLLDRTTTTTATHLETPLHIAAMLGHEGFALELLRRKPELARQLDSRRSSPLHLGSAAGHAAVVKVLLRADPDVCLFGDRDGRNPLHVAAAMGRVDVLREMLAVKPDAARVMMKRGGTILHLCVAFCQFEALKMIAESVDFQELVNIKDKDGNTVLHLAVADKQVETTEFLLTVPGMDLNAVNSSGLTALDVLIQRRRDERDLEMEEFLKRAGASGGKKTTAPTLFCRNKDSPDRGHCSCKNVRKKHPDDWLDKKRSALMVVASLIATMAFQAGVNPPDKAALWEADAQSAKRIALLLVSGEHFFIINTVAFIASLSIILLLMSGLPLNSRFFVWTLLMITWIAISSIALTYAVSVIMLTPREKENQMNAVVGVTVFAWICLMTLLLIGHTIRLFVKMVRMFVKMVKSLFGRKRRAAGPAIHV